MDFAGKVNGQAVLPKRRETRLPAALNIRILGIDANGKPFHQAGVTLDISLGGARITGITAELNPGDIVGLQSGGDKCRFRVSWTTANPDGTHQAGLCCVEKGKSLWHDYLQKETDGDRRCNERYPCTGSVSLRAAAFATPIWGTLRDVGAGGCYVQSVNVAPVGEIISGQFVINGVQINAVAEVRSSRVTVGMGLLWCDLGWDGQAKLNNVLRTLAISHLDANSSKQKAMGQMNKIHQLATALRERLESNHSFVDEQLIEMLGNAEENLTAALKSVQG
ncbi:MAG TPA: PilZ domain-containing protein [Candidatus Saccharimonadales bacterium]|nr:PilZ domain-containing protein [Candidatus Saccharimonadales bacterium]